MPLKSAPQIGKTILVGLTYMASESEVRAQEQLHGTIKAIGDRTLVFERADGEGQFSIPFDGSLEEADPEATYNLKSTGEAVTGVHFLATYTIYPPKKREELAP